MAAQVSSSGNVKDSSSEKEASASAATLAPYHPQNGDGLGPNKLSKANIYADRLNQDLISFDYNTNPNENNYVKAPDSKTRKREAGFSEIIEIMEEDEEFSTNIAPTGERVLTAINEGGDTINSTSLFSIDITNLRGGGADNVDVVYVAVGKSDSSLDALLWTLDHAIRPGATLIYLVHIFSDVKFIPSPLGGGWVAKSQVSRDLVESYTVQETSKRRQLLTKYVDRCTAKLVQVETILIESDSVVNAITDLISILNIQKLIVGISKSNVRKLKGGKWNASTVAEQLLQSAPQGCQLRIICQGQDVSSELTVQSPSSPLAPTPHLKSSASFRTPRRDAHQQPPGTNSFSCCFRPSF